MLDIAEMHHQSLWKRSEVISNTKITTFSTFNLSAFVILCTYCFKCVDGEESIFGLFDYSGYDCSNLCMNKGISAAPGLLCTALIKLSMTCSLVCWLHLFISLLIFVLFFRLCQFCNMLIGMVRIIQLDSQLDALWFPVQKMRVLKMSDV